jgi:predicted enzyme related to lactoylglutathione lyase
MIIGAHCLIYVPEADAAAVQAWFRDVARLPAEESMPSWPLYGVGGAEMAVHPSEGEARSEVYLLCDDVEATVAELTARGAEFSGPVSDQGWGRLTGIRLPGGGTLGLYEPRHQTAAR